MNDKFKIKPIVTITQTEYKREYGVFGCMGDAKIHTDDEYTNLIVSTHSEFIAKKICELLEIDEYMYNNEKFFKGE